MPIPGPENILSLWDDAVEVPPYPTYSLKRDDEGNLLRDMDLKYIPDWNENLMARWTVAQNCAASADHREMQKIFCKSSILYFVNMFCWTYDPRRDNPHIPFVTFPIQDDVLTWSLWLIKARETGLIEKSRDMGLTWLEEAVSAYMIVFFKGMVDYQMSLREDDVDSKTEDSLFGKLRYILRNLPPWMRSGWMEGVKNSGADSGIDNKMLIQIPETRSVVRGQLTMGTGGRSGRATRCFNDEFAFVDDAHTVLKAISALAPSHLYGSTPNGMGNVFYTMAHAPNVRKKTLHWTLHPLKNSEWARKERAKLTYTDEIWAQEQELSYEASTIGRVYPEFRSQVVHADQWCHIQDGEYVEYDPHFDVYMGMDMGFGDPTSIVWAQLKPPPPRFIGAAKACLVLFDEEEEANRDVFYWRAVLQGKASAYRDCSPTVRERDPQRADYRYKRLIGDYRTGGQRTPNGQTWIQMLGTVNGMRLEGRRSSEMGPITEVKRLLQNPREGGEPGILIVCNRRTVPNTIKAFQNWSFEIDKETRAIKHDAKPKHPIWSHSMKAVCYLVDYEFAGGEMRSNKKDDAADWNFKIGGLGVGV